MNKLYLLSFILLPFFVLSLDNRLKQATIDWLSLEQDTIPPTVNCLFGLVTIKMSDKFCVTIHAKDFDRGSFDNLTPSDKLKFYFDGDRSKDSITICCDDFVAAGVKDELLISPSMWVEDQAGNKDYCKITVLIQDNLGICPIDYNNYYQIAGNIKTERGDNITSKVTLTDSNNLTHQFSGNEYLFYDLMNGKYELCLERNDNPLNGVTTADIVKITRHILGIEILNSPYKLLAADVNRSKNLTAADVTEIRRLILGLKKEFTYVPSWIFVPKDLTFAANKMPDINLFIPSCNSILIKDKSIENLNYLAIKMGDVTQDAQGLNSNKSQTRNQNITLFYYSDEFDNNYSRTDFRLNNDFDLSGLQFTLAFNPNDYEFAKIENGILEIDSEQYSLQDLDKGKIHFAWDRNPADKSNINSVTLFSISWKRKSVISNEPILTLDPLGIKALIIDRDLNEIDLTLQSSGQNFLSNIKVYQDINDQTIQIDGLIPKESNATYSIIDITGHVVLQKSVLLKEGLIHEGIPLTALAASALYFFKIEFGQNSKILKLLNFR